VVENYDFVNGAPAVGCHAGPQARPGNHPQGYEKRPCGATFTTISWNASLPNIQLPNRRFFTTNDPVMTPELINYFFNQRTTVFAN
jgi:hypothetical protein